MTTKFNDDVKAILRASGMTDDDITRCENDLAAASQALSMPSATPIPENLLKKIAFQTLILMGDTYY